MSGVRRGPRVALVSHDPKVAVVSDLASSLTRLGCPAVVVRGAGDRAGLRVLERGLAHRGFVGSLAQVPSLTLALRRATCDLVHVFSPVDAVAARAWAHRTGRPLVFSLTRAPERRDLADRRGQLRLLSRAVERCDVLTARDEETADAAERWLLRRPVEAPDAEALATVYRSLR